MKKIISTTCCVLIFFLSCKKSNDPGFQMKTNSFESIHKDQLFQAFIMEIQNKVSSIKDIKRLNGYLEDGNLSEDELSGMHEIYGYEDQKSYFRAVQTQINRINELNKKYNFSELSSYEKRTVIFKTFKEINLFQIEKHLQMKT